MSRVYKIIIGILIAALAGGTFYHNYQLEQVKTEKRRLINEISDNYALVSEKYGQIYHKMAVFVEEMDDLSNKNDSLDLLLEGKDLEIQYKNDIIVSYEAWEKESKAIIVDTTFRKNVYYSIESSDDSSLTFEVWFNLESEMFKTMLTRRPSHFKVRLVWDGEKFLTYVQIEGDKTAMVTGMVPEYSDEIFKDIYNQKFADNIFVEGTLGGGSGLLGMLGIGYTSTSFGAFYSGDTRGFYFSKRFYPFK